MPVGRNQRIARKRAKVEHVFAGLPHLGVLVPADDRQAWAKKGMTMMAACYNMKRLASFMERGNALFNPAAAKARVRLQPAKV